MVLMRSLFVLVCVCVPVSVQAQWSLSTFTGTNHTLPSTLTIDRPDVGMELEFENVKYDAKPFGSAPYYGARVTRFLRGGRGLGVEVEFLHIKVYARTQDVVQVTGTSLGLPVDARLPMNTFVERYNQTHGLNFLFANLVWRQPLGDPDARAGLSVRGGVGPTRVGRDIVMPGLNRQGYQFAGIGAQVAVGLDVRLSDWLSTVTEYKFTHARPELDLSRGGTGRMVAATHNVTMGITIGRRSR